jgi:two-component system response regulator AtoC
MFYSVPACGPKLREHNDKPATHILIVEDEENLRHMLVAMLAKQGYCCDVAENGAQALPLAGSHAMTSSFVDIRMP